MKKCYLKIKYVYMKDVMVKDQEKVQQILVYRIKEN